MGSTGTTVNCSKNSLNSGSYVFTLVVLIDSDAVVSSTISNTANGSSETQGSNSNNDPNLTNNHSTANTIVTAATNDISVAKKADSPLVPAGAPLGYTITMTNPGPSQARNRTSRGASAMAAFCMSFRALFLAVGSVAARDALMAASIWLLL